MSRARRVRRALASSPPLHQQRIADAGRRLLDVNATVTGIGLSLAGQLRLVLEALQRGQSIDNIPELLAATTKVEGQLSEIQAVAREGAERMGA